MAHPTDAPDIPLGLTFDDVLLQPRESAVLRVIEPEVTAIAAMSDDNAQDTTAATSGWHALANHTHADAPSNTLPGSREHVNAPGGMPRAVLENH